MVISVVLNHCYVPFLLVHKAYDMAQMLRVKIFDNMKPLWFKVDLGGGWLFKFWSGHGNESL